MPLITNWVSDPFQKWDYVITGALSKIVLFFLSFTETSE